ncbi:MAG: patatin-like phospholipase family protein [Bacilli bacterium]|nr:patatin-like phospholipase family protein [Bacilli bacterium]
MKALVLCGGGSLGIYEIGAWKYLEERGEHFDIITGSSIGALNGALLLSSNLEEAIDLWNKITAEEVMVDGFNMYKGMFADIKNGSLKKAPQFMKIYLKNRGADITPFKNLLKKYIKPKIIVKNPIKLGIVTTLYKGQKEVRVLLNEEPEKRIIDWLLASSACFPIFPMYKIGKETYVDGGYSNNLPIDYAIELGADEIVAIPLPAFPKVPQHSERMKLPFVKAIRPSHPMGFLMNFDRKTLDQNYLMGYLDARRAYGETYGNIFYFKKDPKLDSLAEKFVYAIAKTDINNYQRISDFLVFNGKKPISSMDMFIRTLEELGSWIDIDFLKEYELQDFLTACHEKILKLKKDKYYQTFAKRLPPARIVYPKDRLAALDYCYNHYKDEKISKRHLQIRRASPESEAVYFLFRVLSQEGYTV